MRNALILFATLALAACSPSTTDVARDVEDYGFTEVQIGSWSTWYCGKDDLWGYHFKATNAQGRRVSGVVCGAALKGATVRILRGEG